MKRDEKVLRCPYRNVSADICSASLFGMRLDRDKILNRCSSECFSDCALFLSKALRSA
jgi:hypothetical protein